MARARNIKPSIMDNEELAELGALHRLLFIYLWMLADREGRLEDRPKRIAAQALPYDRSADVDQMLNDLASAGFLSRYTVGGVSVIQVLAFAKHQTPHVREAASSLPENKPAPAKELPKHDLGSAEASPRSPDSGFSDSLIPDTGLPDTASSDAGDCAKATKPECPEGFEQAWREYPQRPGASRADSLKAWKARVREGVDPQSLIDGVLRYAAYCRACQTDPSYIKQPATFFGPGRHYEADWTPPARASPRNGAPEHRNAAAARAIFGAPSPEYIDV